MNEEMKFCQSCGMPMQTAGDFGTEADGGAKDGQRVTFSVDAYPNDTFEGEVCDELVLGGYLQVVAGHDKI